MGLQSESVKQGKYRRRVCPQWTDFQLL